MEIQNIVTEQDTETLDAEIAAMTAAFTEEHYLNNDEAEHLEMIAAKSMVLGELYERAKWQATAQAVPEGFVVVSQKDLLELTIAINAVDLATHTESKTNEVREIWQQVALKLMALGISQEPTND